MNSIAAKHGDISSAISWTSDVDGALAAVDVLTPSFGPWLGPIPGGRRGEGEKRRLIAREISGRGRKGGGGRKELPAEYEGRGP